MKTTLVVLAAGMGSRYGGLKQIDPVGKNGEALLDYAIYDAIQAGFNRVVFIIRRDFEAVFRERVEKSFGPHIEVAYAYQELTDLPGGRVPPAERTKPWGTAHALRSARDVVNEPFAVINADDFYGRDAYVRIHDFLMTLSDSRTPQACERFAMAGYLLRQTLSENGSVARGICEVGGNSLLKSVTEHTKIAAEVGGIFSTLPDGSKVPLTGDEIASMNIWGFPPALFTMMEDRFAPWLDEHIGELKAEWFIPLIVNNFVAEGLASVEVRKTESRWFGVTYREDRPTTVAAIQALTAQGVYPEKLW